MTWKLVIISAAAGIFLGWWFVRDCERYDDEHFAVNDDYQHWNLAGWNRWKELHLDRPPESDD
jgi:hypothetical protein